VRKGGGGLLPAVAAVCTSGAGTDRQTLASMMVGNMLFCSSFDVFDLLSLPLYCYSLTSELPERQEPEGWDGQIDSKVPIPPISFTMCCPDVRC